jgi:ABC-type uncharacterized transport system, permease and ATPase components
MTGIFRQFYELCGLFLKRDAKKLGLFFFFIVLVLQLGGVVYTLLMVSWTAKFYDALQQLDVEEVITQIGVFFMLIGANSARSLIADYLEKIVKIRWRWGLTEAVLEKWMHSYNYWRLKFLPAAEQVDNPDQRIADDCRLFLTSLVDQTLGLITRIVGLVSYVTLLWSLSTFPLEFEIFGYGVSIPHYMVWAAFIYVAIASCWTHFLGKPMKRLLFDQQRREADLRFSLVQIRRNSDEIAILGGDQAERRISEECFEKVVINWRSLINREFVLGCFTRPYMFSVLRLPLFVALPAYLAQKVTFGGLMQISQAFSNVVNALSWFIFSYRRLSDLAATASRLHRFLQSLEKVEGISKDIVVTRTQGDQICLKDVTLRSPDGEELLSFEELTFSAGAPIWLQGDSGLGKTTMLRAIAGFWPFGKGEIEIPRDKIFVLPQRPYFPIGTLKEALCYPEDATGFSDEQIQEALKLVDMEKIISNRDDGQILEGKAGSFSGGEQQRLALARAILMKPKWVFLDEATSALDRDSETRIFENLQVALPDTTIIVVAHHRPAGLKDLVEIQLSR